MKAVVLFFILIISGCLAAQKQIRPPMGEGEALYRAKCSVCHRPYVPSAYTYGKLQGYVKKYGGSLTDGERRVLSDYLKAASNPLTS